MDNPSRSERSRNAAIKASLAILAREGPGALTFDRLTQKSGISKGGLLHQFRTKRGILKALLDYQRRYFTDLSDAYLQSNEMFGKERNLAAQIAVLRESVNQPSSVLRLMLAVLVEDPLLLETVRDSYANVLARVQDEATDDDVAVLRWAAAVGLAFTGLFDDSPLLGEERERLFGRLLDGSCWEKYKRATRTRD